MRVTQTVVVRAGMRRIREGFAQLWQGELAEEGRGDRREEARVRPRLTIREVMQGQLTTVRPETPLEVAAQLMIEQKVSSLPVVEAGGRIVGALNEKDMLKVFYEPNVTTVGSIMTRNPIVMSIDAPLVSVVDQLMSSDFRRVLIHEDGRLVGVIVRTHLMPAVLQAIEETAAGRADERAPH